MKLQNGYANLYNRLVADLSLDTLVRDHLSDSSDCDSIVTAIITMVIVRRARIAPADTTFSSLIQIMYHDNRSRPRPL